MKSTAELRRAMHADNMKWGDTLSPVPSAAWPQAQPGFNRPIQVWRSRRFLVQVFAERDGAQQVTVNRTAVGDDGRWRDGITWDELQTLKWEIGRGHHWAVELYPPDEEIENDANMRHLWLIPEPAFGYRPSIRGRACGVLP